MTETSGPSQGLELQAEKSLAIAFCKNNMGIEHIMWVYKAYATCFQERDRKTKTR